MVWRVVVAAGWLICAASAAAQPACARGNRAAALANGLSLSTLIWSPFGRVERGWEVYAPLIAREVRTRCGPTTPGFATALAQWQRGRGMLATGTLDAPTFDRLRRLWQSRRPYMALRGRGICPPPPARLASATVSEGYLGKSIRLRPKALAAYRSMVAKARNEVPVMATDARWLSVFSGYRDPAADDLRCARERNCGGITRARCSAHRTGLALDLYVGQTPGYGPDSTRDPNRRAMTTTAVYAWLLANARTYGFVNYAFEPWHWEYTGEAP